MRSQSPHASKTVSQLRDELRRAGLRISGVKEELVARLDQVDHTDEQPVAKSPRKSPRTVAAKSPEATGAALRRSARKSPGPSKTRASVTTDTTTSAHESEPMEFGGPIGAVALIIFSHVVLYYLWISWRFYDATVLYPTSLADVGPWLSRMVHHVVADAAPTREAALTYGAFFVGQALLTWLIPGMIVYGLPMPHLGGLQLPYVLNGVYTWYASVAIVLGLHVSGVWQLTRVYHIFGPLMTVAILTQDVISVLVYIHAHVTKTTHRMSGNVIYDFFMGASLNPRIGSFDVKMWAETREAWVLLFLLTCSAAAHQIEQYGELSLQMAFMLYAHFVYVNAIHKGEECIPSTWDIFYEKWGWMLAFWNGAGVPYVYCFTSWFIATRAPSSIALPTWFVVGLFVVFSVAYYFWDSAQQQRNTFRMKLAGTFVGRNTFPQLPYGILDHRTARYIETKAGSKLLIDGWWRYARKLHYTCDVIMALTWGLVAGFSHVLPYFYCAFFTAMIIHRTTRDIARCERKYGADWERYKKEVPYLFIPYVF